MCGESSPDATFRDVVCHDEWESGGSINAGGSRGRRHPTLGVARPSLGGSAGRSEVVTRRPAVVPASARSEPRARANDGAVRCAITVDLHRYDDPRDIGTASAWLAEQRIPTTFFVPSVMFEDASMTAVFRELPALGHEVGSHAHYHDYPEVHTLISGDVEDLGFLSLSHDLFREFYGMTPRAFRCPLWCYLGKPAREELVRLGYRVDSSATPQRPPFLTSLPFEPGWSMSSRRPRYWSEGLLEIPTSSLLQPASIGTFSALRGGAGPFLRLLMFECQVFRDRVLALQFHAGDFCPHRETERKLRARPRLVDWIPQREGGLRIRHYLNEFDPRKIQVVTRDLVSRLQVSSVAFVTMSQAATSADRRRSRAANGSGES